MRDLFEQIRLSLKHELYYLALFGSIAVSDICGVITYPSFKKVRHRYSKWFVDYVSHKYLVNNYYFLNGEACYSIKCSMLH